MNDQQNPDKPNPSQGDVPPQTKPPPPEPTKMVLKNLLSYEDLVAQGKEEHLNASQTLHDVLNANQTLHDVLKRLEMDGFNPMEVTRGPNKTVFYKRIFVKTKEFEVLGLLDGSENKRRLAPMQNGLCNFFELFSQIIPVKTRKESFEPAYDDIRLDYAEKYKRFKSPTARKWLGLCFILHVSLLFPQCFWALCSEKVKQLLAAVAKEIFRKITGR